MNNVRQSKKRDAMLALLRGTTCHPPADWVYHQLKAEYPDLSLGTVYRNLNQLCGRGLIRRVGPVNGQERYDGTLSPHSHFICNRCGAILDLPQRSPGQDWLETASVQYGFQAESCEFIVRGLCHECTHAQPDAQI
ncbi:MAG: transcriptional repressor [Oscillospiraceae bacterium]|jgi:Fe2+ or Zn2+ uptake regulation protein|nr:transcriptional repressor [Oscillospiraceae bacterium]MCI9289721.1 transcriptional repressor [Oscillospiraceae bacterium]MCI9550075.1 transcriptional repressor [Oscillospiraceae bacterium]